MCVMVPLRVTKVIKGTATMEDGRVVRLGPIGPVSVGDHLEVYADMAIGKADTGNARAQKTVIVKGAT